ncbi:MAG TPA: PAS domain S-box protein [Phycisphaerae bacterium]|nr:PAS domain S-box protein [Phycisphaerae bacterium]
MSDLPNSATPDDLHRLLFNQAGMAMVAVDRDGKITAWNRAAQRIFGAPATEMLGSDWVSLIPLGERENASRLMTECLNDGSVAEFEFAMRDELGERRKLAVIVTPVAKSDGQPLGGLACVRDITNRLVLQERLAYQTKMAALGEMAGAMSHHFNNMLGSIVTSVDFALQSQDPEVLSRVLRKTADTLNRSTNLVSNLLAFAEGDFRDATYCELGEAVIDTVSETQRRIIGTKIELDCRIDLIPVLPVPRTAMMTMLRNLVDNAIEAMPEGGKLTMVLSDAGECARIVVADTGLGLDEESISRIFEPFYTTKRTDHDPVFNRGLGLAVAHGILKVLHGSFSVKSTPGHGAEFVVTLPYAENNVSR